MFSRSIQKLKIPCEALIFCFILLFEILSFSHGARMVRLCIASVDPVKLSSQCVMCNRREFPLTAIDCTGITKVNDLISNPLSVQQATCLIYNCRRQVPDVRPEPYHGSVSHYARTNNPSASVPKAYEMMAPHGMFGGYPASSSVSRYGQIPITSILGPFAPTGLLDSPAVMTAASRQQGLPYAIVPQVYLSQFGARNTKAALVPLFR